MVISRAVFMPGLVSMAVTVLAVITSTQIAVSMPSMMIFKWATEIEMWNATAVLAVSMQVLVVVIESVAWIAQLLLKCCQSRTKHSILFEQLFYRCGCHRRSLPDE
jgi:hypothetical protein